jgi:peptide chain release factor subunit 1
MIKEKGTFGIINIENKEGAVGWVKGSHIEIVKTMTSGIHSKHDAGGQSQRRMERLIEEGAQNFYIRVGEAANQAFMDISDLEGIFISGAGMAKEKFFEKGVLDYRLKDKVMDLVDVSYSGEEGIRETLIKVQDKIANLRYIKEKKIYAQFMSEIVKDTGKAIYGENEIRKALNSGAVRLLLISENLKKRRVYIECPVCNYHEEKTMKSDDIPSLSEKIRTTQCPQCASNQYTVKEDKDIIEDIGEFAKLQGTVIELLSRETEEGESLYSTFGGIGALLRYNIENK